MSIEMNFGWLNDYTGSRFAPFTLANLVLMQTSAGSVESFYDYVQGLNVKFISITNSLTEKFQSADKRLVQLTWKDPEYVNAETNEIEPVPSLGVHYANRLTDIGNKGGVLDEDGIDVGTLSTPVYFLEGRPAACYGIAKSSEDITYTKYNEDGTSESITKSCDIIGETAGGSTSALDININGISASSHFANRALYANYAENTEWSGKSQQAQHLAYDIKLGQGYKDNVIDSSDKIYGDIVGTIQTLSDKWPENNSSSSMPASLELKKVLSSVNEAGYGQAYKTGTIKGTMYVPSFKLDTKGRIIEVQDYQYNIDLKLDSMASRNDINTAYLVTVNAPAGDNPNYIYSQGSNTANSIYIEWGSGVSEPVLMGAAWNDYAEYRNQKEVVKPGYCVKSNDDGRVERTTERMSICDGIVSDTYGFSIGKNKEYQTPLAVSGRVLAYCEGNREDYHAGDVVCASENGKVCKMTREEIREYPDRIVGTVSEIPGYDTWNKKKINGRIWIKVK